MGDIIGKALFVVLVLFVAVLFVGILAALPLMWLWNWLMPELFGLQTIGFWQAFGLLVMSGLLFKSSSPSTHSSR